MTKRTPLCFCPECQTLIDPNDMVDAIGKLTYHTVVCSGCYENLETDDGGEINETYT